MSDAVQDFFSQPRAARFSARPPVFVNHPITDLGDDGQTGLVEGPQGPQGEAGDIGALGYQGFTGSAGAQGATGPQGERGGQTGPDGDPGAQGGPGAQGFNGDDGPQGAQGNTGADGADGPQGPKEGMTTLRTRAGIHAWGICEGTEGQWFDLVPARQGLEPAVSDALLSSTRLRSVDGAMDLIVGIPKHCAGWRLPECTEEQMRADSLIWKPYRNP